MYDRKTPGNQSTEAIQISLANFNKHIENINQKTAVSDMEQNLSNQATRAK